MKNVIIVDKISENRATKIFNTLCKHTDPFNECVTTYMGGNKFKSNSYSVGVEIECSNKITECILYGINIVKKHLILGNVLK